MIKAITLGTCAALSMLAAMPASAQTSAEQRRFDTAQRRYDAETNIYNRERQAYDAARGRNSRGGYNNDNRYQDSRYNDPRNDQDYDRRYATDYDATRYYRDDARYQERTLGANDQVYRGSDGRYYCKRNDGTTGLIIGGLAGGVGGNLIDGGRNRVAGTLIGGALGALLGKSVDQNSGNQVRCR